MAKVLVVDDDTSLREFLEMLLSRAGYQVVVAATLEQAKAALVATPVDVVVTDLRLGSQSGLDVVRAAQSIADRPEVIVVTAFATAVSAVEAMRQGAYDYIGKPFDNAELLLLVERAFEKRQLAAENKRLKATIGVGGRRLFVGSSPAMAEVWAIVDKVAPTRSTVLITGESGVGKEIVARTIHERSPRVHEPFVAVNCAAISEGVLESEIFGHVRGAFTGANADRDGLLVSAGEGTVFLDEIGELPASMQVKLLRVLQERMVKPVGSSREVPYRARVLAATNRNLEQEVAAGRFREDLFFRLNVISILVPPLRERRSDIRGLAQFFLERSAHELGRPGLRFAAETEALLESYRWNGNLRQLQNAVERAATLSDSDEILPSSLPPVVRGEPQGALVLDVSIPTGFSLEGYLEQLERRYLEAALKASGGSKSRAAQLLGLSFRSFRYRLAKNGMREPDGDGGPPTPP